MFKQFVPASALSINPTTKLTFSYAKTKENLTKIFQEHNDKYMKEKALDPKTEMVNFPQSFINTAFTLTQLFIAEFQKGKIRNGAMKMCKVYIKRHMVGSKLSLKTIGRHIERLVDNLSLPFISQKSRSTLGDIVVPGKDRNCISISFVEGVIASETTKENLVTTKNVDKSHKSTSSTTSIVNGSDDNSAFWAVEVGKIFGKADENPPKPSEMTLFPNS